ncbi:MAG: SDR family NAD(P)-dependent oxidoreductase [Pseudomonadota bacterium]
MTDQPLKGKVAVVTGAGRSIGKSTALVFAKAGAELAICARAQAEIVATAHKITALGPRCFAMSVDVADPAQNRSFCDGILADFGTVDIIIVNSAVAYLERGAFADSDPDLWWKTTEVNVRGPYMITRNLINDMRQGGKLLNLTFGKGYSAGANSTAYHLSKAALNMLTDGLANELWSRNIDVNSLVPGPTAAATFDNAAKGAERSPEEILAQGRENLPKGLPAWERVKHPDEVGHLRCIWRPSQSAGQPGKSIH